MKRMLWMLPLLFAGMTAAAQNQDMARLGTYMDNGEFVVGTAETVLAADITVRCEKIVCLFFFNKYIGSATVKVR